MAKERKPIYLNFTTKERKEIEARAKAEHIEHLGPYCRRIILKYLNGELVPAPEHGAMVHSS